MKRTILGRKLNHCALPSTLCGNDLLRLFAYVRIMHGSHGPSVQLVWALRCFAGSGLPQGPFLENHFHLP